MHLKKWVRRRLLALQRIFSEVYLIQCYPTMVRLEQGGKLPVFLTTEVLDLPFFGATPIYINLEN